MNPCENSKPFSQPLRIRRMPRVLCAMALLLGAAPLALVGCITHPWNPAATQPATEIDPATTRPAYYLDRPAVATVVDGTDYNQLWGICENVLRGYLFTVDREDYRNGDITTVPLVSKQVMEVWRPDTGTTHEALRNNITTMRRTLYLQLSRDEKGMCSVAPKVLVEQETIVERRITDVAEYHSVFSGPLVPAIDAVKVAHDIPSKYWTPIGRDLVMERKVAVSIRHALARAHTPSHIEAQARTHSQPLAAPDTQAQ